MKNIGLSLFFICGFLFSVSAQRNVKDSIIGTPWIAVQYDGNQTYGDLAKKYGYLNHVGVMAGYKTSHNWFFGFDGNFVFGNKIKINTLFDHLKDSYGNVYNEQGGPATVVLGVRGFNANFAIGKVFPILSPNENSGIFIHCGAGLVANKIRIETNYDFVPELELNYRKGYDRYTMGPNVHLFIGYAFMANQGLINFYGGFYAQEGFTHNMRKIFFDQPDTPVYTGTMHDIQAGFRVGWFIPFYRRKAKDFYID